MRTLGLLLMIAGGVWAQDQPAPQGQFFPPHKQDSPPLRPLAPFRSLKPPLNPPRQSNFIIRDVPPLNAAAVAPGGRCAVPLIEMKAPAATDSIARTVPNAAKADPIAVAPPAPACGTNSSTEKAP